MFCDAVNKKQPDALRFSGEKRFLTVDMDLVKSNDYAEPRGKVIHNCSLNNLSIKGVFPRYLIAASGKSQTPRRCVEFFYILSGNRQFNDFKEFFRTGVRLRQRNFLFFPLFQPERNLLIQRTGKSHLLNIAEAREEFVFSLKHAR